MQLFNWLKRYKTTFSTALVMVSKRRPLTQNLSCYISIRFLLWIIYKNFPLKEEEDLAFSPLLFFRTILFRSDKTFDKFGARIRAGIGSNYRELEIKWNSILCTTRYDTRAFIYVALRSFFFTVVGRHCKKERLRHWAREKGEQKHNALFSLTRRRLSRAKCFFLQTRSSLERVR